jgi:hypothetical protein
VIYAARFAIWVLGYVSAGHRRVRADLVRSGVEITFDRSSWRKHLLREGIADIAADVVEREGG